MNINRYYNKLININKHHIMIYHKRLGKLQKSISTVLVKCWKSLYNRQKEVI